MQSPQISERFWFDRGISIYASELCSVTTEKPLKRYTNSCRMLFVLILFALWCSSDYPICMFISFFSCFEFNFYSFTSLLVCSSWPFDSDFIFKITFNIIYTFAGPLPYYFHRTSYCFEFIALHHIAYPKINQLKTHCLHQIYSAQHTLMVNESKPFH